MKNSIKLNNGFEIPTIGFGTYLAEEGDSVFNAVTCALNEGYRLIDTASFYKNELGIGNAIKASDLPRESVFLTTKVWNTDRGYESTLKAFEESIEKLGVDYIDIYLIHWPANEKQFGKEAKSINASTWKALETLYKENKVKAIGLSNFLPHHIDELMETAEIKPMINQIEFHPGYSQFDISEYCKANEIAVEAWSPLGRSSALNNSVLSQLADKYSKTPAQICLRWEIQNGIIPIPKSLTASRIKENFDVFDFCLSDEDIILINNLKPYGKSHASSDEIDF